MAFAAAIGNTFDKAELEERINFLSTQRERLLQKRADWPSGCTASTVPYLAMKPLRALVIDSDGAPEPTRDGGSGALVSHMRSLRRIGYEVAFASPQMTDGLALDVLRQDGVTTRHAPWFHSVEEVLRREEHSYDVVYLHRLVTAAAYANLVRRYQPRARLIYSVADLHHLRLARQAIAEESPQLMAEAHRVRAQELWAVQNADTVITHSPIEGELLRKMAPTAQVHVMAWSILCRPPAASFAQRSGMAFVGNFRHAPNIAAVLLLRNEIMPAVQAVDPTIICTIVGQDAPAFLAQPHPGLDVVGQVPDLQAVFGMVRLTVAPLTFGAGLKSKVLESLAAGLPCLCSPAAAEGLELPSGMRDLIVPNTEAALAVIVRLHQDRAYNRRMARLGLDYASFAFSEARLDAAMRGAVGQDMDVAR